MHYPWYILLKKEKKINLTSHQSFPDIHILCNMYTCQVTTDFMTLYYCNDILLMLAEHMIYIVLFTTNYFYWYWIFFKATEKPEMQFLLCLSELLQFVKSYGNHTYTITIPFQRTNFANYKHDLYSLLQIRIVKSSLKNIPNNIVL